eukprot:277421-Chlamydomonas_euryale.AAC.1
MEWWGVGCAVSVYGARGMVVWGVGSRGVGGCGTCETVAGYCPHRTRPGLDASTLTNDALLRAGCKRRGPGPRARSLTNDALLRA